MNMEPTSGATNEGILDPKKGSITIVGCGNYDKVSSSGTKLTNQLLEK